MSTPETPPSHRLRGTVRSIAFVLGLGAVSWAWSEVGFWAHLRAGDSAASWIASWLLYSLVAGLVLRVVRRLPELTVASIILVGALYGWLVEGMAAATVYLALPVSIVWTGVAWHGLLTVGVGWIALPAALRRGGVRAVVACAVVGAAWGLWSVLWWSAPPDAGEAAAEPDVASYAGFVVIVSLAAYAGYVAMARTTPHADDLRSRRAALVSGVALVVWWAVTVVVAIPWAPVLLGALVAVAWYSLRRIDSASRHASTEPTASVPARGWSWDPGVPWRAALPLVAVPVVAIAVYAALAPFAPARVGEGVGYVAFVATIAALTVAGVVALVWALWQAWRPRAAA